MRPINWEIITLNEVKTLFLQNCFHPVVSLLASPFFPISRVTKCSASQNNESVCSRCETVIIQEVATLMVVLYFAAAETKTQERQLLMTCGYMTINIRDLSIINDDNSLSVIELRKLTYQGFVSSPQESLSQLP